MPIDRNRARYNGRAPRRPRRRRSAPTVKASANTPSGATHSTQPMMTSSASAMASNRLTTVRRAASPDARQRQREQQREHDQRQHVAVRGRGDHVGRDHALEEVGDARQRRRSASARSPASARAQRFRRRLRQREQRESAAAWPRAPKIAETVQTMTIHSTDRAGDPPGTRRLGALGDAGHEQGDDQRDDRHLQRVQPQGADERGDGQRRVVRDRPASASAAEAEQQSEDQRGQRPISAEASRGFLCRLRPVVPLNAASGT